jgi:hypothetical protein
MRFVCRITSVGQGVIPPFRLVVCLQGPPLRPPPHTSNISLFASRLEMALDSTRPRVFLDITVDREPAGRLAIELFTDEAPNASEKYAAC